MGTHLRTRTDRERHNAKDERAVGVAVLCVSLAAAIPLTAIGVAQAGLAGLLISWTGIVLVNLAHALRSRRA
jgi:hypothetical protein